MEVIPAPLPPIIRRPAVLNSVARNKLARSVPETQSHQGISHLRRRGHRVANVSCPVGRPKPGGELRTGKITGNVQKFSLIPASRRRFGSCSSRNLNDLQSIPCSSENREFSCQEQGMIFWNRASPTMFMLAKCRVCTEADIIDIASIGFIPDESASFILIIIIILFCRDNNLFCRKHTSCPG
jgi:hypothetical protein